VDALFETISNTLAKEEKIQLVGFGTFEVRDRAARTGRNLHTGEEIQIAASKVPAFKPGKELKEAVKKSNDIAGMGASPFIMRWKFTKNI
jgi:DNA-binding protein HU-beta